MDIVKSLGHTVVAAVHDLNIAAMYCDRLIAIQGGKVVSAGTPKALLTPDFIKKLYDVDCEIHYGEDEYRLYPAALEEMILCCNIAKSHVKCMMHLTWLFCFVGVAIDEYL